MMRQKIFLSWSKNLSKLCATAFYSFFNRMGGVEKVFLSKGGLVPGDDFEAKLIEELRQSLVIFAFITRENAVNSRWMEFECSGVFLAAEDTLLVPVLIDLEECDLPEDSIWRKPFLRIQKVKVEDFKELNSVVTKVRDKCGFKWSTSLIRDHLSTAIETCQSLVANTSQRSSSDDWIMRAFKGSDREFASWAYQYHRVIHQARDLVVRVCHKCYPIAYPDVSLEDLWKTKSSSTPILRFFNAQIKDLLNAIQDVFSKTISDDKIKIWTCLRELRKDGCYYNVGRSAGYPADGGDIYSVRWPSSCAAVVRLNKTLDNKDDSWDDDTDDEEEMKIGPNCTIITDISKKCWPPVRGNHGNPYRKQSILGAVLLKKVTKDITSPPKQAKLWLILCVNSNAEGVFTPAHQRLLQGFNDALSTVANVMVRCSAASKK